MSARVLDNSGTPEDGTVLPLAASVRDQSGAAAASASRDVVLDRDAWLSLGMESGGEPVQPGELMTYGLVFGNRGSLSAAEVVLQVPVPDGTSFVAASGGGTLVSGMVEWPVGPLGVGESGERWLTVQVAPGAVPGDVVRGDAVVFDAGGVAEPARASAVAAVRVAPPLSLSVSASPDPVRPGDEVVYQLTVTNRGAADRAGVVLEALIPTSMQVYSYYSADLTDGGVCLNPSNCDEGEVASWSLGTLLAGASRTVAMSAQVLDNSGTPDDGTVLPLVATTSLVCGTRMGRLISRPSVKSSAPAFMRARNR
jgi:uncharacterized repeat protein (TIGR01451 family)